MKRLIGFLTAAVIALRCVTTVIAEDSEITVIIDGERMGFEVEPIIENDRVLVPMRAVFEKLGAEVEWRDDIKTVYAAKALDDSVQKTVTLKIGDDKMQVREVKADGDAAEVLSDKTAELDATARISGDRTLVPLRAVSEAFGCEVSWDAASKTVTISQTPKEIPEETQTPTPVTVTDDYVSAFMSQLPEDKNIVVSPFSLKTAMIMTANGATGETQKEILTAFDEENIEEYNSAYKELAARLNNSDDGEVSIANSLWFNSDCYKDVQNADFSESFKNTVSDIYGGAAEKVTNENSIEAVNEWTENATNGKIQNLLSEDSREYLLCLVNAIYMKADWASPFTKESTYKDTFTDINGQETEIDFMHQTSRFGYYENGGVKVIRMPYKNGLSMYVVLGEAQNIADVIEDMTSGKGEMSAVKKVRVAIPKFKIEYDIRLNDILDEMGVKRAFEDFNHDFDGMVENVPEPIKIDTVLQKAIIEVDEKGTEAAAATAVMMAGGIALAELEEIMEFTADRPFSFYIAEDASCEVLFSGRFVTAEYKY